MRSHAMRLEWDFVGWDGGGDGGDNGDGDGDGDGGGDGDGDGNDVMRSHDMRLG